MKHEARQIVNGPTSDPAEPPPVVVYSVLCGDPAMRLFLEEFIADVPSRLRAIHAACRRNDLLRMSHLAMLLKGAATGFGFAEISQAAEELSELGFAGAPMARIKQALMRVTSVYEAALRGMEWGHQPVATAENASNEKPRA